MKNSNKKSHTICSAVANYISCSSVFYYNSVFFLRYFAENYLNTNITYVTLDPVEATDQSEVVEVHNCYWA